MQRGISRSRVSGFVRVRRGPARLVEGCWRGVVVLGGARARGGGGSGGADGELALVPV